MTTLESIHFRPTKKYWRSRIIDAIIIVIMGVISIFVLFALGALNHILIKGFMSLAVLCVVIVGPFLLWLRIKAKLILNKTYIKGNTGFKPFQIAWDEVVAIKVFPAEKDKDPQLIILTQAYQLTMDLTGFDETAVSQAIEQYTPSSTLEPDAYKDLDHYQIYVQDIHSQLPLKVSSSRFERSLLLVCTMLFPFLTIMSSQSVLGVSIFFGIITVLSMIGLLTYFKSLSIDTETLIFKNLWKTDQIKWSEIDLIEVYLRNGAICFHYQHKELVTPALHKWHGKRRAEFLHFFDLQVDKWQIEVKENRKGIRLYF